MSCPLRGEYFRVERNIVERICTVVDHQSCMTMNTCGGGAIHWKNLLEKDRTIAVYESDGGSETERNVRRKEKRCGEQIDRELGLTSRSDLELWIACGKPGIIPVTVPAPGGTLVGIFYPGRTRRTITQLGCHPFPPTPKSLFGGSTYFCCVATVSRKILRKGSKIRSRCEIRERVKKLEGQARGKCLLENARGRNENRVNRSGGSHP